LVDERVKVSVVAVTVRFTCAVCDPPNVPLAVPETVIVCTPVGKAMLAAVVMVKVTGTESVPSSVTLAGLKLQSAPAGRPAVQLPGAELVEFVKLMVAVEPFTGVMVRTAVAVCPAGMELGDRAVVTARVKSDAASLAFQATARALASTEPRPVTGL
jgi:hypothetical protein